MKSSVPVARATATLPRNWSRGSITSGLNALAFTESKPTRKRESSSNPSLILKRFFANDCLTTPTIAVEADETASVASTRLEYTISPSPPRPRAATTVARSPSSASIGRLTAVRPPASPARSPQRRQQLLRKQSRRQSISPSFFEPTSTVTASTGRLLEPGRSELDGRRKRPPKLTVRALSAHDDPAGTCLSAPISSLFPSTSNDDEDDEDSRVKVLRRCASFNVASSSTSTGPGINLVKPSPDCLDDHSNPSSRDPFFYAAFEGRLTRGAGGGKKRTGGVKKQPSTDWSAGSAGGSLGSGCVTAWVVEDY